MAEVPGDKCCKSYGTESYRIISLWRLKFKGHNLKNSWNSYVDLSQ